MSHMYFRGFSIIVYMFAFYACCSFTRISFVFSEFTQYVYVHIHILTSFLFRGGEGDFGWARGERRVNGLC